MLFHIGIFNGSHLIVIIKLLHLYYIPIIWSFSAHNNSEYIKYNKVDLKKLQIWITKISKEFFGHIKGTVKRLNEYAILKKIDNGRKPSL
jgi:hypothetical protein